MRVRLMILSLFVMLLMAAFANAAVWSPIPKGEYNSEGITLSAGSPSWSADLSSSTAFIDDVYQIGGYCGGASHGNVEYQDDPNQISNYGLSGPFVKVGPNTGGSYKGWVLYKFVLPSGYVTGAGGTITADALRVNNYPDPQTTWMGVSGSEIQGASTVDLGSAADEAAFTKTNFPLPQSGWGDYGTLTLDIPTGVSQFYVAFLEDWGNEKICYQGLTVNASVITTPWSPIAKGYYNNAGILLNGGVWNADISTFDDFLSEVHQVGGYYSGNTAVANVEWSGTDYNAYGAGFPYLLCGPTTGGSYKGWFVYKFVLPAGCTTGAGGTVTANAFLRGDRSVVTNTWLGVSDSIAGASTVDIGSGATEAAFVKDHFTPGAAGWDTYLETLSVAIPAGKSVFYVALLEDWSSNRIGITSLTVDSVVNDTAMPVMMYLMPDNRLLKYELDRMATNDIGMSGATLGGWNIADDPNDANGITAKKESYKDIITAGLGVNPPMRHFAVKSYMGYTTSRWPANTWAAGTAWNNAITGITSMAQACAYAGIRHICLDAERYVSLDQAGFSGTYLMSLSDATSLTNAYQRGIEVAQAISAAAPDVDVILAPEMGTGYMGSTSAYPAWHRFRNGLLDGSSTLNVYMYVEGTYTGLTGVNDNDIQLYGVAGSYTDPAAYKTALTNYLNTINTNIRNRTDTPSKWDARGGIVPGIWVLGTANDRPGKRSAWYTPELFAAQLEAYVVLNVPLAWEYAPIFAWKQWFGNEVSAAGMYPYDGNPNPDNNNNWVAEVSTNPYLEAYKDVLVNRGMPSPKYAIPQSGDIDGDAYVDLSDIQQLVLQWLEL